MEKERFYQQTWFVVLALFLIAPLGVFLMYKYKPWNKIAKIILSIMSLISFLGFISAMSTDSQSPDVPRSETTSVASESPTETKTEPSTTTDAETITHVVTKEFGEDNFISVNCVPENNFVLIKAKGKDSLTSSSSLKSTYLSMNNILKSLSNLSDYDVAFNIVYAMKDTYGNITEPIVIKATYTAETRNKINWDNFSWKNVPDIADEWWIHESLKNAME